MTSPSLLNMPEVVMNRILENLKFKTILTLRKVCHDLRNFIDDVIPDAHIQEIQIAAQSDRIAIAYSFENHGERTVYKNGKIGCTIHKNSGKSIFLKNQNFMDSCFNDFSTVIRFQKSISIQFWVSWVLEDTLSDQFFDRIGEILKSMDRLLKVRKFRINLVKIENLTSILPFLNAENLEKIDVSSSKNGDEEWIIDELVETDQWKKAKKMDLSIGVHPKMMQYFMHFEEVSIRIGAESFEKNFEEFKEIFIKSPQFKKISLIFKDSDYHQQLLDLLGPQYFGDDDYKKWHYRIPYSNQMAIIYHETAENEVGFCRIDNDEVSNEAVIQDF